MSNFELKNYSCAVSWKVILNLVNHLFKWVEVLSRSVIILVGSETEITFDIGHLRKKNLTRCQILSHLKKYSCAVIFAVSWKLIFILVKDLFKWVEVLSRSVIILVGSETENIWYRSSTKMYLTRCQISSSKNTLVQFHEKWFSVL